MTHPKHPAIREDCRLRLVTRTAIHVGAAATDVLADLALATDGQGRLYIPGTSWAGVLRALARRTLDPAGVERIFGPDNIESQDDEIGSASRLTVYDTLIGDSTALKGRIELRSGVGIDRRRGAAADRIRYDRLVIAAGTPLLLELRYEGPDHGDDLGRLVSVVRGQGLRIGAASSRGLGRLECTGAEVSRVDLTSRASLLAVLSGEVAPTPIDPGDAADPVLRIRIAWRTKRPVLVGAAAPTATADLSPLLSYRTESGGPVPVLPGASVKGVLRSAAERVVHTLRDAGPPDPDFVKALDDTARLPVFERVFGSRERAGALRIADTAATVPAPATPVPWSRERTHVAIDRWTGGASEGRLFTVDETQGVTWSNLEIELDLPAMAPEMWRAAVLLLGVAVGQFHDGGIGFGHGTTRGLGEIEVTDTQVTVPEGIPPYSGQGWWAWLREVADGRDLPTALGLEQEPA